MFPKRNKWTPTDEMVFIGDPPLFRPNDPNIPVRVSITFTWDIQEGKRLLSAWKTYYNDVRVGGPAFGDKGYEFIPGLYLKEGVTITSRGCPKKCKWCYVPEREGKIRTLEIKNGWIVQDNNLLACPDQHIKNVFEMLKRQGKAISFNGGLDTVYLKEWHRKELDEIKIKELWFACDTPIGIKLLEKASKILEGIKPYKRRCYVMIGWGGETLLEAEKRLERVYGLGFYPFCQLYRNNTKIQYDVNWRRLARKWSRPAAYNCKHVTI